MGQIKIFGIKEQLHPIREKLSEIVHECIMDAFQYPKEKKAHRFIYIEKDSFFYFDGRTDKHTISKLVFLKDEVLKPKRNFTDFCLTDLKTN